MTEEKKFYPPEEIPGPPEPEEFFPGYGAERLEYTRRIYELGKRAAEAKKELTGLRRTWKWSWAWEALPRMVRGEGFVIPMVPLVPGGIERVSESVAKELSLEGQQIVRDVERFDWRGEILDTLPLEMRAGRVRTFEDAMGLSPSGELLDEDIEWLRNTYSKLIGLVPPELPEEFTGPIDEAQSALLKQLLADPKVAIRGVHHLTVEELRKSFMGFEPKMPEGMTPSDIRDVMRQIELDPDELLEINNYLQDRADAWKERTAYYELVREGILNFELAPMTPGEFFKLLFVSPAMATFDMLDKYFNWLPRPAAMWIMMHSPTTSEQWKAHFNQFYEYYRSMGESSWDAYSMAFNDSGLPWWAKIVTETIVDPTTYLGLGVLGKAAYKIPFLGRWLGPAATSFDTGWIVGSDALFKVGKEAVLSPLKGSFWLATGKYGIPKTITTMARDAGKGAFIRMSAMVERLHPDKPRMIGLTAQELSDDVLRAARAAADNPLEVGARDVQVGLDLLQQYDYLTAEGVDNLVGRVSAEVPAIAEEIAPHLPSRLGGVLSRFRIGVRTVADETWARTQRLVVRAGGFGADAVAVLDKMRIDIRKGAGANLRAIAHEAAHLVDNQLKIMEKMADLSDDAIQELRRLLPGAAEPLTPEQIAKWRAGLRAGDRTGVSGEAAAEAIGRWMLDPNSVSPELARLFDDVMGQIPGVAVSAAAPTLDVARVARVNDDIMQMMVRGVGPRETAGQILADLSLEQTDELVETLARRLTKFKEDIVTGSADLFRGTTPKEMLSSYLTNVQDLSMRNLNSEFSRYMREAGTAVSWVSRVADRILYSNAAINLERKLINPTANWYLLFSAYGPFNFLENIQRSYLGGGEMLYPRSFGGVYEFDRMCGHLPNFPYEMKVALGGYGRLDIAFINPKTGTTEIFKGGKIPGITRDIPRVGEITGKVFKVGGKTYKISSFQSWNDMWADLTTKQRAWDYMVHYKKALIDKAPTETGMISDAITARSGELDSIRFFSKSEARDYERVFWQDGTVSPELIAAHARSPIGEMNRRKISYKLGETFDKCTELPQVMKNGMRDDVLDGTMFTRGIDDSLAGYADQMREMDIVSLQNEIEQLKEVTAHLSARPPDSLEELYKDLDTITNAIIGSEERLSDVRRLTEIRSARLTQAEKDNFEVASAKMMADYMQVAQEQIDSMLTTLRANANRSFPIEGLGTAEARRLSILESEISRVQGEIEAGVKTKFVGEREIGRIKDEIEQMALRRKPPAEAILPGEAPVRLTEQQLADLQSVEAAAKLRTANILSTRQKIFKIEAEIPATKPKARNDAFWASQRARKSEIWDGYFQMADNLADLHDAAARKFRTGIGSPVYVPRYIPEVTAGLTPNHVAYLLGNSGDDIYQLLIRGDANVLKVRPKRGVVRFIREKADNYAAQFGKTADDIGFTKAAIEDVYDQMFRNIGLEPGLLTPDTPRMTQLEEVRQELHRLEATVKMSEDDYVRWQQYINGLSDDMRNMPIHQPEGAEAWLTTKESAMAKAREMHALAYPIYDDYNIIDETMRKVFPFWTYEMFRWRWLPRTFLRTPGTLTGMARYTEYTDQGYIPVPGTNLQFNLLRSSIWMGGLRRLYLRDFPEYYDAFPGMEFVDYLGRLGFYPGFHVMLPISVWGMAQGKPELGEVAPSFVRTGLAALRAAAPDAVDKVIDHFYPDRFRDFMTMSTLAEQGYDADEIWSKKKTNIKLTEEEEKLWLRAEQKVAGVKGLLMEQFGIFRIRPQEYTQLREDMRAAIEEITGVPAEVQDTIDRRYPATGKRFSDYYKLDVLQTKMLYEHEAFRRWRGVTTPLYPSSWQLMEAKITEYYGEVERLYEEARKTGVYEDGQLIRPSIIDLNNQWVAGVIGPDQWMSGRSEVTDSTAEAVRALSNSPAYKDVPKTFDERAAWLQEKGVLVPTLGADQELLYYYYEIRPEYRYSWDSGRDEMDFDSYYAKIDMLLDSLAPEYRQRLLDRIQYEWTPLERLYWEMNREYFRPYNNIRGILMNQYDDEQRQLIRRFEVARGAEREAIQDEPGPEGQTLIANFNSKLRTAHERLRKLDPELDAWLYFFGKTDTFQTPKAEEIWNELTKRFLTPAMIGNR